MGVAVLVGEGLAVVALAVASGTLVVEASLSSACIEALVVAAAPTVLVVVAKQTKELCIGLDAIPSLPFLPTTSARTSAGKKEPLLPICLSLPPTAACLGCRHCLVQCWSQHCCSKSSKTETYDAAINSAVPS